MGAQADKVETSGDTLHIGADASVSTFAANGPSGSWLLDPKNILIASSGSSPGGQTFGSGTGTTATIDANQIATALDSGNVILQANTDITVNASVIVAGASTNTLTLQAGRSHSAGWNFLDHLRHRQCRPVRQLSRRSVGRP